MSSCCLLSMHSYKLNGHSSSYLGGSIRLCVCVCVHSQPQASTELIHFRDVLNFLGHVFLDGDGLPHGSILGPLSLYGSRWKKNKNMRHIRVALLKTTIRKTL